MKKGVTWEKLILNFAYKPLKLDERLMHTSIR